MINQNRSETILMDPLYKL